MIVYSIRPTAFSLPTLDLKWSKWQSFYVFNHFNINLSIRACKDVTVLAHTGIRNKNINIKLGSW